jgi:hypothetical protein
MVGGGGGRFDHLAEAALGVAASETRDYAPGLFEEWDVGHGDHRTFLFRLSHAQTEHAARV